MLLKGKRIIIQFQGVEEALYVWLNVAILLATLKIPLLPSEFDLMPYIQDQGNVLWFGSTNAVPAAFLLKTKICSVSLHFP